MSKLLQILYVVKVSVMWLTAAVLLIRNLQLIETRRSLQASIGTRHVN